MSEMKPTETIAAAFFRAFYKKEWVENDETFIENLSIEEAYEVQDLVAKKRMALGESIAGFKVGCTSKAIREQFGLREPINARLFRPHIIEGNVTVDWTDYVNCAIEPEIVLKIGNDLKVKNPSNEELIDSIEYVSPGIEIHNLKFWNTPPTTQELICSGGIHAGLIIGSVKVKPTNLRFRDEMFNVYRDGILVTSAPASEIMGGPLHSLRWLVNSLTEKESFLKKGSLVIPGSPVELVPIDQDTELKVVIENVGSVIAFFER